MVRIIIDFTEEELAILYKMISIALLSGEIELNDVAESIHKKITGKIAVSSECIYTDTDISRHMDE